MEAAGRCLGCGCRLSDRDNAHAHRRCVGCCRRHAAAQWGRDEQRRQGHMRQGHGEHGSVSRGEAPLESGGRRAAPSRVSGPAERCSRAPAPSQRQRDLRAGECAWGDEERGLPGQPARVPAAPRRRGREGLPVPARPGAGEQGPAPARVGARPDGGDAVQEGPAGHDLEADRQHAALRRLPVSEGVRHPVRALDEELDGRARARVGTRARPGAGRACDRVQERQSARRAAREPRVHLATDADGTEHGSQPAGAAAADHSAARRAQAPDSETERCRPRTS